MADGNLSGIDLTELHDAQFLSLDLDWRTGDVEVRFELDDGSSRIPMAGTLTPKNPRPAALIVRAAVEVHAWRALDWGPSVYVNEADWTFDDKTETGLLRIQMQSGDEIVIRGHSLEAG